MSKVIVTCKNCKNQFSARTADRKRGWAKFCSKSCKAINQCKKSNKPEFGVAFDCNGNSI